MIGTLLLAQLWQVTLVAAVVLVAARFCGNRPHLVAALWLVVLVKAVTPPLWSSPVGLFSRWSASIPTAEPVTDDAPDVRAAADPVEWETGGASDTRSIDREVAANVLLGRIDEPRVLPDAEPMPELTPRSIDPALEPEEAPSVAVAPVPRVDPRQWGRIGVVIAWAIGVLVLLVRAGLGWCRVLGAIGDRVQPAAELRLLFDVTRHRLGVRTPVRLVVTRRGLGPAVVGFLRPTVVLPEAVVAGCSADELEPILVHELLHVRRGDTWTGALQLVVAAAWWFHPLVVWVNRLLTRDVERCCDAEAIAALGRSPAEYARCLVDVLERKRTNELRRLPALPGVRPMDVTATRLERIMRTRTAPTKPVRWATRLLLVALAAIVLPGSSGSGDAAEDPAPDTTTVAEPSETLDSTAVSPETPSSARLGPVPLGFDFAIPVLGPNDDERIFSFYLGFEGEKRDREFVNRYTTLRGFGFRGDDPTGDAPSDDAAPEDSTDAVPAEEETTSSDTDSARIITHTFEGIRFDVIIPDGGPTTVRTRVDEDTDGRKAYTDEISGDASFSVSIHDFEFSGRAQKMRLHRQTKRQLRIAEFETVELRLQRQGDRPVRMAAKRLHVQFPDDDDAARIEIRATDGVEAHGPHAAVTAEMLVFYVETRRDGEAGLWPGAVHLGGDVRIGVRENEKADWQRFQFERATLDRGNVHLTGPLGTTRTIENGDLVIRSVWPVPFLHREPLPVAAADTEPAPLAPPTSADRKPSEPTRNIVANALLGTAPPPRPPFLPTVFDRWQKLRPTDAPLNVPFIRHRYQPEEKTHAASVGRFRLDRVERDDVWRYVSVYELERPAPHPPTGGAFREIDEQPIRIGLDGTHLTITHPGPDFEDHLSQEQASLLQGLQFLQVGYLTDLVRENFQWSLAVEEKTWTIRGRPSGKAFAEQVREVTVMIDPNTEVPTATKMVLADGAETVHVLGGIEPGAPGVSPAGPPVLPGRGSRGR